MSRRGYCMVCAGAMGKRLYHTCGLDDQEPQSSPFAKLVVEAALSMAPKEGKPDFSNKENWINGAIHPNRIPIRLLVGYYQQLGYSIERALQVLDESWKIHNQASSAKDWGFWGDPNRSFESPDLLPAVQKHIREMYPESHIQRLIDWENPIQH